MIKQFAICILRDILHYSGELTPDDMINAVRNYNPPKAEYGEQMVMNYAHAKNTKNGYQTRMSFLLFALDCNFSTINYALNLSSETPNYFQIPENMCAFNALMFLFAFEIEKKPRFSRIINAVANTQNIIDAVEFWKIKTGSINTHFRTERPHHFDGKKIVLDNDPKSMTKKQYKEWMKKNNVQNDMKSDEQNDEKNDEQNDVKNDNKNELL